jgi:hypothetical protein
MNRYWRFALLAVCLILLGSLAAAHAERGRSGGAADLELPSYVPIPTNGPLADPAELLPRRLTRAKNEEKKAQDLFSEVFKHPAEYLKDKKALTELAQAIIDGKVKLPENSPITDALRKIRDKGSNDARLKDLNPQELAAFREAIKKITANGSDGSAENTQPETNPINPDPQADPANPSQPLDANGRPIAAASETDDEGTPFSRWLVRNADWLSRPGGPLADSPELRQTIVDLARRTTEGGLAMGEDAPWIDELGRAIQRVMSPELAAKFNLPEWRDLSWNLPQSVPMPDLSFSSSPSQAAGSGPVGSGPELAFLGLAALILGGIAAWGLYRRQGAAASQAASNGWQLGPWPVDPAAVASREDLVRAFEYLSLLRLGPEARTWNHRTIAANLGGDRPDQDRAAGKLAGLYEQARYAPAAEPLPDAALQEARRELSFLGGVAAV